MGNNIGHGNKRLGIAYMAMNTPNINKATVSATIKRMRELPMNLECPFTSSRIEFGNVLNSIGSYDESDLEIFYALFDLFDVRGDGSVLYRELTVGVVGCLVTGSVRDILLLAFDVYDVKGKSDMNRTDLRKILHAINNTASYFGDNVLEGSVVEDIVNDVFYYASVTNVTDEISLVNISVSQCVQQLLRHESVIAFVNCEGTKLFGQ